MIILLCPLNHSENSRKVTSEKKKVILASRLPALSQALLSLLSVDVKGEELLQFCKLLPQADHKGKEAICQDL